MKNIAFLCFALLSFLGSTCADHIVPYTSAYQDIIVNGEVVVSGWGPNCSHRYDAIKFVLDLYQRPITVLDIGANHGYFSLRIAEEYDSTVVMIDGIPQLLEIVSLNTDRRNTIVFEQWINLEDLQTLVDQEHFDIVLCSFVLHQLPEWKNHLDLIFKLGDQIIIETPPSNDAVVDIRPTVPEIDAYMQTLNGTVLTQTERYTPGTFAKMYWFNLIDRPVSIPLSSYGTRYPLVRNFSERGLNVDNQLIALPKGIHYGTFLKLGGVYPVSPNFSNTALTWIQGHKGIDIYGPRN